MLMTQLCKLLARASAYVCMRQVSVDDTALQTSTSCARLGFTAKTPDLYRLLCPKLISLPECMCNCGMYFGFESDALSECVRVFGYVREKDSTERAITKSER
jgi:hypothetical protein